MDESNNPSSDASRPLLRRIRRLDEPVPAPAHEDSGYLEVVRRMSEPATPDPTPAEENAAFLMGYDGVVAPDASNKTPETAKAPAPDPVIVSESASAPSPSVVENERRGYERKSSTAPTRTGRELGDEVCKRVSILELVSRYTTMKPSGKEVCGCCPLPHHLSDKTPSFFVNTEKNLFNCHGCRSGGNPIKFLSEVEGISYGDAFRQLAKEVGVELGAPKPADKRLGLLTNTRDRYHTNLIKHRKGLAYLASRGISMETIEKFGIGFCYGNEFDAAITSGKTQVLDAALETCILYKRDDSNGEAKIRNLMRGRVVFPIADKNGQTIAFAGRVLPGVPDAPKYLNTHESPFFKKSANLFGLNHASRAISKEGFAIVVEGYMDVAMLHQVGVENSCAAMGGGTNARAIKTLWSHTKRIVFCLDGDPAGVTGAYRSILAAADTLEDGQTIAVAMLPTGMDPDEYAMKYGAEAFLDLCRNATPLAALMAEHVVRGYDLNAPEGRVGYYREVEISAGHFKNAPMTVAEIFREADARIAAAVAASALNKGRVAPGELDHAIEMLSSMRQALSLSSAITKPLQRRVVPTRDPE